MSSTIDREVGDGIGLGARRPTWAEIDLDALAENLQAMRRAIDPAIKVLCVVKANAYGHGATQCARRLATEGAEWFGVALPEEGIELRRAGIAQPILCLEGFWDGQADICLRHNLVPAIYRFDMLRAFDEAARAAGVVADVHIKIDTGMNRLGVRYDEAAEFAAAACEFKHVRVDGLMTHFAAADDPDRNCFTQEQVARFEAACAAFRAHGHRPTLIDMANSAAAFAHAAARGNMVRPGGVLYGLWRDVLQPQDEVPALRPVMSLRSRVTLLKYVPPGETLGYGCTFEATRRTLVATLPIGYHDGYVRALSNRGRVIVRGQYAPVVGRVSMDSTLIDATDVPGIAVNDDVTLLGADDRLAVHAEDMALTAGTISYEITCGISERVPRIYQAGRKV